MIKIIRLHFRNLGKTHSWLCMHTFMKKENVFGENPVGRFYKKFDIIKKQDFIPQNKSALKSENYNLYEGMKCVIINLTILLCKDYIYIYIYIITNRAIHFVKKGSSSEILHKNRHWSSLFDDCMDWLVAIDLEHRLVFPTEIMLMALHLDIVIWCVKLKKVFIIELTIPF